MPEQLDQDLARIAEALVAPRLDAALAFGTRDATINLLLSAAIAARPVSDEADLLRSFLRLRRALAGGGAVEDAAEHFYVTAERIYARAAE
jgi:hypothetical protein